MYVKISFTKFVAKKYYMFSFITNVARAFATVFAKRRYWLIAIGAAAVSFILPILIPVWLIPLNTLSLQLSIMSAENYVLLTMLAIASGMLIAFNVFLFHHRRGSVVATGGAGISTLVAFVGGVITTSCGCGIGLILGIVGLGAGSTFFIIANQFYIILGAFFLVLIGLYLNVRAVAGICEVCEVVGPSVQE